VDSGWSLPDAREKRRRKERRKRMKGVAPTSKGEGDDGATAAECHREK
jgi:hypothetical protein